MSITSRAWNTAMTMIKGELKPPKQTSVAQAWKFFKRKQPHAGQIYNYKTLPNGNVQKRITTAYAGDKNALGIETAIYSPRGELLKAYAGIRDGAAGTTRTYASGTKNDVQTILNNMYNHQGGAKSILA